MLTALNDELLGAASFVSATAHPFGVDLVVEFLQCVLVVLTALPRSICSSAFCNSARSVAGFRASSSPNSRATRNLLDGYVDKFLGASKAAGRNFFVHGLLVSGPGPRS